MCEIWLGTQLSCFIYIIYCPIFWFIERKKSYVFYCLYKEALTFYKEWLLFSSTTMRGNKTPIVSKDIKTQIN